MDQSELDRRHQSAFLKNASVFNKCPQPGRQTKKSNQLRKHKKIRIMHPESSMDPTGIQSLEYTGRATNEQVQ